ncbi:MAG: class I SAM-dependent methyltransferase [Candidatus Moranbacteria bacterium]|nr:class I SAM-dependent methyltransferase [Candidatus Moranbacteria bacterium]MBP9801847.1 class I SAM-dependent methyltransferase [Candidatus Moranbacteria bacterium]
MDIKRKTAETYDKIASLYSNTRVAHFWVDEFDFFKSIFDGNKVIDFGCGEGRDAIIFIQNGFDYTGVDISEGMLQIARERVSGGVFQQADFSKVNCAAGAFDGFWAAASFIHVPKKDVHTVLWEAKRVTKVGGVGFISMKEKREMDEGMVDEDKYGGISRYFSFYTQDEFKRILEENGFSILKFATYVEGKNNWLCYFVKV